MEKGVFHHDMNPHTEKLKKKEIPDALWRRYCDASSETTGLIFTTFSLFVQKLEHEGSGSAWSYTSNV